MTERDTEFEQASAIAQNLSPLDKARHVEQVMATLEQDLTRGRQQPKRSLYGTWSGVSLSADDIDEARREMWSTFPREDI